MKLELKLLDDFKCLGGDCLFSCCQNWLIHVDEEIQEKWQSIDDQELFRELQDSFYEKVSSDGSKKCVMHTLGEAKTSCVQLSDDMLCRIQSRLGHDYLPEICRTYPRQTIDGGFMHIHTARLSCPVISKAVLHEKLVSNLFREETLVLPSTVADNNTGKLELSMEKFVSDVLSNQKYAVNIQVLAIADMLCELVIKSQEGLLDKATLSTILGKPSKRLYDLAQKNRMGKIKIDRGIAGRFWLIILEWSTKFKYDDVMAEFSDHELIKMRRNIEDTEEFYEEFYEKILALRKKASPSLDSLGNYGARYMRVKLLNTGFPATPVADNYVATFLYAVYSFALIQLYLWLKMESAGKLDLDDVTNIVTRVERGLGHNRKIYTQLFSRPMFLRLDMYKECLIDC